MKFVCTNCGANLDIADKQISEAYQETFGADQTPIMPKRANLQKINMSVALMGAIKYHLRINGWTIRFFPEYNSYTEKMSSFRGHILCKNCWIGKYDPENPKHI